jgi:uncharacterized SAM-binding protein YcdF (DUF218 family)
MIFYLTKVLWVIFNPFNLIIFLILFGVFFSLINLKFISKLSYIAASLAFILFGILPTGSYLNYLLERDFYDSTSIPSNLTGIVILSGASDPYLTREHNKVALGSAAERLTESVVIIKNNPNIKIIFSGGPAYFNYPNLKDSDSAKLFFSEMGVDFSKIIFEEQSKNTFENILFSKKIANPNLDEKWLVISSAHHLRRVINVSIKAKWKLIPYATDFNFSKKYDFDISLNFLENLNQFNKATHEWMGLIYYYLTKKANKI